MLRLSVSHLTGLASLVYCCLSALVTTDLTLTWDVGSPDGHHRKLIKINGQMPGPELRFDEGDDIEITVQNDMPFNATVHWHGLLMRDSPWSDGVPGLSQKPIEPGQSFIYRFKAYPSGTYWYHAHSRLNLLDGLFGPLHIRPRVDAPTPFLSITKDPSELARINQASRSPKLITLSDWSNWTSWEYMDIFEQTKAASFCADSILVNGQGSAYCLSQRFLIEATLTDMASAIAPQHVSDKGCLPFVYADEGYFLPYVDTKALPPHYFSGCLPGNGSNATIEVDAATGWASLNFVMASMNKFIVVSVDEHEMWVYEADGQFITPQRVEAITLYPGMRYAALIKLDKEPKDYIIRVPDNGLTQVQSGFAILSYKGGKGWQGPTHSFINWNGSSANDQTVWLNDSAMPPFPPIAPAPQSDQTVVVKLARSGQPYLWSMSKNGIALYRSDNAAYTPLLYNMSGHLGDGLDENLLITTNNDSYNDIVIQVGWREDEIQEITHVLHKHASKMWIIGAGNGVWNYTDTNEAVQLHPELFNLDTPIYRDTVITSYLGSSWVAVRYHANVPGAWFFHCHIEIHLGGGMGMAILDGVNTWPVIPPEYGVWQMGHPLIGNETYAPRIAELNNTKYESGNWSALYNATFNENIMTVV